MTETSQPKKYIRMEARNLRIHPFAQRRIVPANLNRIKENLDLDGLGTFHAVEYLIDGVFSIWIVDGQHRWRALMDLDLGEWVVVVQVHTDITDHAGASALFLKLNARAGISPYDTFHNEVSAQVPAATGVAEVLQKRGLRLARTSGHGQVCCVSALKRIYQDKNGATLALTLDTLLGAWGKTSAALEGKLIEGLGMLHGAYNGAIDQTALVKKLAKYEGGPSRLLGDARCRVTRSRASLSRGVAETILETYNVGRRTNRLAPLS